MIKKIAIGLAFSPNLKANIHEAIRSANMFNANLIAIHIGNNSKEKEQKLHALLKEAPPLNNEFKTIFKTGKPVDVIIDTCTKQKVDLLIIGAQQKENIYKYYVGSIARKLTRKAPCSVLLLIKPSVNRVPSNHIVVNGLEDEKTPETIKYAFYVANKIQCNRVTIVEEISLSALDVNVSDDKTLRKATITKKRIQKQEDNRIRSILNTINSDGIIVKMQSVFGRCGYSISHYARVKRADLLIMNAPTKTRLLDRIFPHDIEYILSELPTDVLIVK